MLKVNINLHFKGERNYIQGAAVFDALSDICLKAGMSTDTVKLTFKKMLNNGAIIIEERDFLDSDSAVCTVIDHAGRSRYFAIRENDNFQYLEKEKDDEEKIISGYELKGRKISLSGSDKSASQIEMAIALCKKIHKHNFDENKKWIFCEYNGVFPLPSEGDIVVETVQKIGTRLTKSLLNINGQSIGSIYFT